MGIILNDELAQIRDNVSEWSNIYIYVSLDSRVSDLAL